MLDLPSWITSDMINALFEIAGALMVCDHIRHLLRDKSVAGVSTLAVVWFTTWSLWNVYYYNDINQIYSWCAAIIMGLIQTTYLILLIYYRRNGIYTIDKT